jgi:hypothetical protein
MLPDLSIALCLRDDERRLADIARAAVEVGEALAREYAAGEWADSTRPEPDPDPGTEHPGQLTDTAEFDEISGAEPDEQPLDPATSSPGFTYELIALDESSRDNTLSVLSILHAKLPQLRTLQGLAPGTAVMRAARTAQGRVWLIVDAPFAAEHGLWAARQVFCGDPAAMVPGEVLAVHRNVGQAALGWLAGGLVSAQHEVERLLEAHDQRPAWSPPQQRALRDRARLFVRGRLGRLGLGQLDRRRIA